MTDTPLSAAEATLWNEAKRLTQMMRDEQAWKGMYTDIEWIRAQEFYLVAVQLRYESLLDIRPDSEIAAQGLETVQNALVCLAEWRQFEVARAVVRAGRGPDVD